MRGTWLILALLLVPSVQAYHLSTLPNPGERETVDTRNRVLATHSTNLDNAAAGILLNFTFPWDPEYSFQDKGHTIRIHVGYTAAWASNSNGAWNVTVASEKGFLTNCTVRVETVDPIGISLDALLVYAHFAWDCIFTVSTNVHYHYHTVWVNRTSLSGTPAAMTAESVAVRLETEDVIITCPTESNLEVSCLSFNDLGFDGFLLLLFWIAALLFFSYQEWWFALGFSLPGLMEVLFPSQIPEDFTVWFTFCLLGVMMEIAANRFSWGHYKQKRSG